MLDWLGLERKVSRNGALVEACLRDRKTLEMFGYVVRTILQKIVIEAVKAKMGSLKPLPADQSLSLDDYKQASDHIRRVKIRRIDDFRAEVLAEVKVFNFYKEEHQTIDIMAAKQSWDKLSACVKKDYANRIETEAHIKSVISRCKKTKTAETEYVPINYYGHFLRDQIKHAQSQR